MGGAVMVYGVMDLTEGRSLTVSAKLRGAVRWALSALWQMPLANPHDLAAISGRDRAVVDRDLRELEASGLAESVVMGWTKRKQRRWWLSEAGNSLLWEYGPSWNSEGSRCRLLEALPMVEWFYRVSAEALQDAEVLEFRWLDGLPIDAAVRSDRGWVALMWSGMWESGAALRRRFESLGTALRECSETGVQAWPGMFCVVASDHWQRELVLRAARELNMLDRVSVWSVKDGSRSGAMGLSPSRGWVWWPLKERKMGNWPWEKRVENGLVSAESSYSMYRCLDLVAEWPGAWESALWKLGDCQGRRMKVALDELVKTRYVERYEGEGRFHARYGMSNKGVNGLSRRDRVSNRSSLGKSRAVDWYLYEKMRRHEDGVIRLMGDFARTKAPVASGWRCEDTFAQRKIVPDGQVYLTRSPFGPGWHYLEFERRVRSKKKVANKMSGYLSDRRLDDVPVLVVCWNERVEGVFHEVCRGLDMLTVPVSRLNRMGAVGVASWSLYGEMVTL